MAENQQQTETVSSPPNSVKESSTRNLLKNMQLNKQLGRRAIRTLTETMGSVTDDHFPLDDSHPLR